MCIYIHFQGLYDINLINLFPTSYPRRNGAIPLIPKYMLMSTMSQVMLNKDKQSDTTNILWES